MLKRILIIFGLLALALPVFAQAEPVVFGVFFYSPTCSHCHKVITEDWPGIQEEFGSQLQVLFINVNTYDGLELMKAARAAGVMTDNQQGVPMLVIGEHVLIGDINIPSMTPDIVRAGLAAGGIDFPPIPGIHELYDQAIAAMQAQEQATAEATAEATEDTTGTAGNIPQPPVETTLTLSERLAADPVANALAIGVLAALAVSLLAVLVAARQAVTGWLAVTSHWITAIALLAGGGLAVTLALGGEREAGESILAVLAALLLALGAVLVVRQEAGTGGLLYGVTWLMPLILVAGLIVAGYLTYVEVTANEAVCGIVGDCNAVQQSEYALLFGVLPVGVLGLAGYIALLLAWVWGKATGNRLASTLLLLMALGGVGFSLYLTFLEPFVIGATCIWCLTSAVIMIALLWLTAPDGLAALKTPPAEAG